jgi:hypothetical protein
VKHSHRTYEMTRRSHVFSLPHGSGVAGLTNLIRQGEPNPSAVSKETLHSEQAITTEY